MAKLLLIAEKPSLMRELKGVYNKNKSQIKYDIDFTALAGHICRYAKPDEYNEWNIKWNDLFPILPIVPENWQVKVMKDKNDLFKNISDMLKTNNYDGIICATDADREGNLIFHLLENKLKVKTKVLRLWVHDLTEKAILSAFTSMVDMKKDTFQKNLTYASILRSRFDWLVGMNYTIAATINSTMLLKIGRVKTPTLKMVYDNSMAIENFVPETTYGVECEYKKGFTGIMFNEDGEIFHKNKADAEKEIKTLGRTAKVLSIKKETVKTLPPQLFKLSDLQVYINKKFGFTAEKTLQIAQSLYEKKILSYPRCDCRYISSESTKTFPKILKSISVFEDIKDYTSKIGASEIGKVKNTKKYTNDKEVNENSHTALIPTGEPIDISKLSDDEKKVYEVICKRFVCIFLEPCIEEKTVVITENNGKTFRSNGKTTVSKGWTELVPKKSDEKELPKVSENEILDISKISVKERTTTPPARLTEGSLIAEMENISKYIEDNNLKTIMKEAKGIGTPSSRSAIISSLIKDGYINVSMNKKSQGLYISDKGKDYIENIKDLSIVSPVLTAEWESKLRDIEKGAMDSVEFNKQMKDFLNENIETIKNTKMSSKKASIANNPKNIIGICPRCGNVIAEGPKSYYCTGYKNDPKCTFTIWKENKLLASQKKKVTTAMVRKLLKDHTYAAKGLVSQKTGNKYNANIVLEDTGTSVNLKIEFPKGGKRRGQKQDNTNTND